MADTQQKSAELAARLDRLPFSKWHRNFFTVCFLGVMFDACDFALFGMALPPVAREFGLNQAQAGLLATVGLVGAFVGALFWGTISDYIGRRTSFAATIGIFSVFTGLVGTAQSILSLSIYRFLSNFGLGGEVPVALTLTSEYSPSRIRGRMTGTMMAAFPVGLALAALVSLWLLPTYGWRAIFIAGIVPAMLLFFVRMVMPESVRYLLSRGRIEEAERTVAKIEQEAAKEGPLPPVVPVAATPVVEQRGVTVFELLTPERRKRTLLLWTVSFGFLWASNGIIFMLPTILTQRGFPLTQILIFLLVQALAACVGYTACGFLIDRYGRRPSCSSITSSARPSISGLRKRPASGFTSPSPRSAGSIPASMARPASMSASSIRPTCAPPPSAGSSASAVSARSSRRRSWASCCTTVREPTCCPPSRSRS